MKERISNVLRTFAASLCSAALGALLLALMLSLYDVQRVVALDIGRWVLLLAALACINELLAPRGLPLLVYAGVNAVLSGVGIWAVLGGTVFTPASEGYAVFLGALVALSAIHGAYCAQKLPDSNQFIWLADMLVVGSVLLLSSVHLLERTLNTGVVGFALAALLAALIMTSQLRAGGESESVVRGSGMGGWLVLGGMLGFCLLITAVLLSFAGGQVDGVVSLVSLVWEKLGVFFERLVSLLAAVLSLNLGKHNVLKRENDHYTVTVVPLNAEEEMGTAPAWIVYGFLALLAAALIAVVIGFLFDFRGKCVERTTGGRRRRVVTRKSHLLAALRALAGKLADAIAFEIAYRLGKHTPQGLYVLAWRRGRGKKLGKRIAESPGAYIRRLDGVLRAQGSDSTLDQLADMLDGAIYGGEQIELTRKQHMVFSEQIRSIRLRGSKAE